MAKLTKFEKKALAAVIAATKAESFVFLAEEFFVPLIKQGLVEINQEIVNEAGEVATRATPKGLGEIVETATVATPAVKPTFVIEDNIAMPATKRGGTRAPVYPFESLEKGQSFFIPASEKHPEPAKSLASSVSGATKRYDVLIEGQTKEVTNPKTKEKKTVPATAHTRVFVIRPVDGGARVWRTL